MASGSDLRLLAERASLGIDRLTPHVRPQDGVGTAHLSRDVYCRGDGPRGRVEIVRRRSAPRPVRRAVGATLLGQVAGGSPLAARSDSRTLSGRSANEVVARTQAKSRTRWRPRDSTPSLDEMPRRLPRAGRSLPGRRPDWTTNDHRFVTVNCTAVRNDSIALSGSPFLSKVMPSLVATPMSFGRTRLADCST